MKLHISHGAGGDWFIVQPLEGETQQSLAGTPITHERAVETLRRNGRTVYTINAKPWRPGLRWWLWTFRNGSIFASWDRQRVRQARRRSAA